MANQIFDQEKLDAYRRTLEDVAEPFRIAKDVSGFHRHSRDHRPLTRFGPTSPRETENEGSERSW